MTYRATHRDGVASFTVSLTQLWAFVQRTPAADREVLPCGARRVGEYTFREVRS